MAKINLLPWREELRKKRQQDFLTAIGASVVLTCVIFGLVYLHIESLKEYHQARNQRITDEIAAVDKKIKEIQDIESKKTKLLDKITIIQDLQESRPLIVHVFDELRKVTPKGVYLGSIVQKASDFTVIGKAESNSMVSEYMDAIEASEYLTAPKLKIVKGQADKDGAKSISKDFTLFFKQKEKKKDKDDDTSPTAQPGAK
jgi:type IV pilus assembly protein PilN